MVVSSVSSAFLTMCCVRCSKFKVPCCALENRGFQNLGEASPFLLRVVCASPSVANAIAVGGVVPVLVVGLMVFEVMSSVMLANSLAGLVMVFSSVGVLTMMNASPITVAAHWVGVVMARARVVPSS